LSVARKSRSFAALRMTIPRWVAALPTAQTSLRLSAVFADAIDLEGVAGSRVVVLASDLLFQAIDFRREEFDRAAAGGAHHVMVAAAVVLMLVAGDAVVEGDGAGESALGEELKRAIDGGETDLRVFLADQAEKFVGGEMLARFQKSMQDGVALGGVLEADTLEMPMKDLSSLAHHVTRDGGLIIDALVERGRHEWSYDSRIILT